MQTLPPCPDQQETSPGRVLVELHEDGLDLVVELDPETGETTAVVTWWGREVRAVEVGEA